MKKRKILIIILIIIIFAIIGLLFYKQYRDNTLYDAETGKPLAKSDKNSFTHIIAKGTIANTNTLYTIIYTFNENDILIAERHIDEYATEEEANNKIKELENSPSFNIFISEKCVTYNELTSREMTKTKLIELLKNSTIFIY